MSAPETSAREPMPAMTDTQWVLSQILGALPQRRDWLDPDLEKMARGLVGMKKPAAPPVEEKDEQAKGPRGSLLDVIATLREEKAAMLTAIQSASSSFTHIDDHPSDFTSPELFYWNAKNQCRAALATLRPYLP